MANVIIKILKFAKEQKGLTLLTCKQITELGPQAQAYYQEQIPKSILEQKEELIAKHGFTKEQWEQTLRDSRTFYFLPTPEQNALNKELKRLMEPYIINRAPMLNNYTASLLKNLLRAKKPLIQRELINGVYHYSLVALI